MLKLPLASARSSAAAGGMGHLLIVLSTLPAQAPSQRPIFDVFEVATIKPADPEARNEYIGMRGTNRFRAMGFTVDALIAETVDFNPRTTSGRTVRTDTDRCDISALSPGEVRPSLDEQISMLQKPLVKRFQLTFHRVPKDLRFTQSPSSGEAITR